MIRREDREEGVVLLRLEHGRANAIDLELAEALAERLDALRSERPAPAVVLTGAGSIFSAGVDLFRLVEEEPGYVDRFLPAFARALRAVAEHPRPVVAALNGHAVAGGFVLACACDRRLMAEGSGTVGLPELAVGVPFPRLALRLVAEVLPAPRARELVYGGGTRGPREALELGLVDAVAPPEELLERAAAEAARLGAVPPAAFALTKSGLLGPALATEADRDPTAVDARVLACWKSPEVREAVRSYLERTFGRSRRAPGARADGS